MRSGARGHTELTVPLQSRTSARLATGGGAQHPVRLVAHVSQGTEPRIDEIAERHEITRSWVMRAVIEAELAKAEKDLAEEFDTEG